MDRIGVIGLGRMGSQIAARMGREGAVVTGWTRSGLTPERAAELGIARADTLGALVSQSDMIVTSLLDDAALDAVLTALRDHDLAGRLIIETSTVTPGVLGAHMPDLTAAGAAAVDAPISGGPDMVAAGSCGIFLGGAEADASRATAALSMISGRIFHVGPLGTGLVMKTINNAMIQCYTVALGELMPVAKRAGLPMARVLEILSGGPGGMPFVRDRLPRILGEDDSVGFALSAAMKDNAVFQAVLAEYDAASPMLTSAGETIARAVAEGLDEADPAALISTPYRDA